jgi:hypothetical protein
VGRESAGFERGAKSGITGQTIPAVEERVLPIFKETERIIARIRRRAVDLSSGRGFQPGWALNDWLMAECGHPGSSAGRDARSMVAGHAAWQTPPGLGNDCEGLFPATRRLNRCAQGTSCTAAPS